MTQTQGLSTRNLNKWPDASKLKNLCKTLATLSWVQMDTERFEMQTKENGTSVFQFSNGEGDTASLFFNESGVLFKGFAHESIYAFWGAEECPWPKDDGEWLPKEFRSHWESDIEDEDLSFIAWYLEKEKKWSVLDLKIEEREEAAEEEEITDADGSEGIWDFFPMTPELYAEWEGAAYYEKDFDLNIVRAIYKLEPLTKEMIMSLNPDFDFSDKEHIEALKNVPYPTKM